MLNLIILYQYTCGTTYEELFQYIFGFIVSGANLTEDSMKHLYFAFVFSTCLEFDQ